MNEKNDEYIFSQDDLLRLQALKKAIESLTKEVAVFEEGYVESQNDLDLMMTYKTDLMFAQEFLRTSGVTVSMIEYERVVTELKVLKVHISDKKNAMFRLAGIVSDKKKDLQSVRETARRIIKNNRLGIVLDFRKPNGK